MGKLLVAQAAGRITPLAGELKDCLPLMGIKSVNFLRSPRNLKPFETFENHCLGLLVQFKV